MRKIDTKRYVNISDLQYNVKQFVADRKWEEFHTPKDISLAISVEANELLKMFVWKSAEKSLSDCKNKEFINLISEEIADIVILCASLSNYLNLDLGNITAEKIEKNKLKYPANESKTIEKQWK